MPPALTKANLVRFAVLRRYPKRGVGGVRHPCTVDMDTFLIHSFVFGIFCRLSNGSLVISHCMQIFNLVSIWMQIKLVIFCR